MVIQRKEIVSFMVAILLLMVDSSVGLLLGSYQGYLPNKLTFSIIKTAGSKLNLTNWELEEWWLGNNLWSHIHLLWKIAFMDMILERKRPDSIL